MRPSRRDGFTLVEVLIALVLTAVIGAAVTSVFVNQSAFYDTQAQVTEARSVSRAAVNMLTRELRGVDTSNPQSIQRVGPDTLRVRVPYALGVACGKAATGRLHVSVVPVDSAAFASATFTGYMWRDLTTGAYTDGPSSSGMSSALPIERCIPAGVTTSFLDVTNRARVVSLQSPSSGNVPDGAPILIYQTVTYYFAPSTEIPGTRALWRQVGANQPEELAAPFDASSRFRFYVLNGSVAVDAPPSPITNLRGVELALVGRSDRPDADGDHRPTPFTTAIFFRNRID